MEGLSKKSATNETGRGSNPPPTNQQEIIMATIKVTGTKDSCYQSFYGTTPENTTLAQVYDDDVLIECPVELWEQYCEAYNTLHILSAKLWKLGKNGTKKL
jgi:hypothetical protein